MITAMITNVQREASNGALCKKVSLSISFRRVLLIIYRVIFVFSFMLLFLFFIHFATPCFFVGPMFFCFSQTLFYSNRPSSVSFKMFFHYIPETMKSKSTNGFCSKRRLSFYSFRYSIKEPVHFVYSSN